MWKNLFNLFKQDDLYTQALHESYTMLDLDLQMFQTSIETLRKSDTGDVKIDIYALDKRINAYERDVRRKVITHLTVSGPAGLTSGLVLVSVVIDIERIGDYAKNIYDLATSHQERLVGGSLEKELSQVEDRVAHIFREMVAAFKTGDIERSRAVMVNYKEELSQMCDDIVDQIVSGKVTDLSPAAASAIALYVRYLKRIAGHSRNILTSVVNPFHRIGYREKTPKEWEEA